VGVERLYSIFAPDAAGDELTVTVDFGDGTQPVELTSIGGLAQDVPYAYATPGVYLLTVTVNDSYGGTGSMSASITVADVVADAGPDRTVDEGSEVQLGGGSTPGADPYTSVTISAGDGSSPFGDAGPFSYRYTDEGVFATTVVVDDDAPGSAIDEATITVLNVAPTASMAVGSRTIEGVPTSFRAFASDPGREDVLTYNWDFGDGASGTGTKINHVYTGAGSSPCG
jgi:hypothetical protein